jgi:hypothetical protein
VEEREIDSKGHITPSCNAICTCIGATGNFSASHARVSNNPIKFKINISCPPYSNETFYTKALEYKEYFTLIDLV